MTPAINQAVRAFRLDPTAFTWIDLSGVSKYTPKDYFEAAAKAGVRGPFQDPKDIPLPFDSLAMTSPVPSGGFHLLINDEEGLIFAWYSPSGDQIAEICTDNIISDQGLRIWYREMFEPSIMTAAKEGETVDQVLLAIQGDVIRDVLFASAGLYGATPSGIATKRKPAKGNKLAKHLYDWNTVVLAPKHPASEPKGGTHASPRPHDRRGYFRTYKTGKQVWVRNCKVGKGDGFIFKDYIVKPH